MKERHTGPSRRLEPAVIRVPEGRVRVLESHHAAGFEMETGTWPFHKICWVAVGKGRLEAGKTEFGIRRDDFLLLPADWPHRFVDAPGAPLTLVILCLSRTFVAARGSGEILELWETTVGQDEIGRPCCARTAFHHRNLLEDFRLALREQGNREAGWQTALEGAAIRLLIGFARGYCEERSHHVESSGRSVLGAIEYVNAHPYEALQIEEMAERCHLSPRRFTDLFKRQTGTTFNDYLNQKRIEYARARLDETGHILYACHESGFNDLSYFYRIFKKSTGMTPGEYVKRR